MEYTWGLAKRCPRSNWIVTGSTYAIAMETLRYCSELLSVAVECCLQVRGCAMFDRQRCPPVLPCSPLHPPATVPQKLWMRGLPSLGLIGGPAEGQVVVVTGPTSGIGRETAAALAARGARGERQAEGAGLAPATARLPLAQLAAAEVPPLPGLVAVSLGKFSGRC